MTAIDKRLQAGQTVRLTEVTAGYQVTVLPPEEPGQTLVAVGPDYIVCDDEAAGVKTRIPVHLLVSVMSPETAPAPAPEPAPAPAPQAA
jgi:hypothetical protein